MLRSISAKFVTIFILSSAMLFIIIYGVFTYFVVDTHICNAENMLSDDAKKIEASYIRSHIDTNYNLNAFYQDLTTYSTTYNRNVIILDDNRTILYTSDTTKDIKKLTTSNILNDAYKGTTTIQSQKFSILRLTYDIEVAMPIYYNGSIDAIILLHSHTDKITEELRLFIFVLLISFSLIQILYISFLLMNNRVINKSLEPFNHLSTKLANGDFSVRINTENLANESKKFGESLNYMVNELEKLEDLRKDFLANISHDFRSPLTSIKGYSQAMLDGTIPCDRQEKYLNIIINESDRLTKLTNDILLLTKMENNVQKPEYERFELHELIRTSILKYEQTILKKDLQLTLLFTTPEIYVCADINQIQRVIVNLIDNAIKFSNPEGTIDISTELRGDKVYVSIADSGVGITEDDLNYIWSRFHKADRSRGKDRKGTGLGLSIVHEIMRSHSESIDVFSQYGKGTTFTFTLHLAKSLSFH